MCGASSFHLVVEETSARSVFILFLSYLPSCLDQAFNEICSLTFPHVPLHRVVSWLHKQAEVALLIKALSFLLCACVPLVLHFYSREPKCKSEK